MNETMQTQNPETKSNNLEKAQPVMVIYKKSSLLAAILSIIIPGAGQLYKGKVISAIVWFVIVGIGYFTLFIPGLILHFFCIVFAALSKAK